MKKKFKFFSSLMLALSLSTLSASLPNVDAVILYNVNTNSKIIVVAENECIQMINEDGSTYISTMPFINNIFTIDELPQTSEEITKLVDKTNHSVFRVNGDDEHLFYVRVKYDNTPYYDEYGRLTNVTTKISERYFVEKEVDLKNPTLKIDLAKNEVRDYITDEVIRTFDNTLTFYNQSTDSNGNKTYFEYTYYKDRQMLKSPAVANVTHDSLMKDCVVYSGESSDMIGDFDNSGLVDLTDLTILSLYMIGDTTFSDKQIAKADCNSDGKTDLADLAHLKQYIIRDDVKLGV